MVGMTNWQYFLYDGMLNVVALLLFILYSFCFVIYGLFLYFIRWDDRELMI